MKPTTGHAVIVLFTGPMAYSKARKLAETVERVTGLTVTMSEIDIDQMQKSLIK